MSGATFPDNADGSSALMKISSVIREDVAEILSQSPFFNDSSIYPTFRNPATSQVGWNGAIDADGNPICNGDGRVFVEVNDASSGNNFVKVRSFACSI